MDRRVAVTGLGVLSCIGNDVKTFWDNLVNGVCGIDYITEFPTEGLAVKIGGMIRGFDAAVAVMDPGQTMQVHLAPSEAYGEIDPGAVFSIDIAQLPGAEKAAVGDKVYLQDAYGRQFPVRVSAKDENTITFDANHEMAGKELNFSIELVEVEDLD